MSTADDPRQTRYLSKNNNNPKEACRPFDISRDGLVAGEGAGIIILEELNHAVTNAATCHKSTDNTDYVLLETSSIGFGVEGFLGAEHFVAPKLSIIGQFSWGPMHHPLRTPIDFGRVSSL